jgi:hypothetical protein
MHFRQGKSALPWLISPLVACPAAWASSVNALPIHSAEMQPELNLLPPQTAMPLSESPMSIDSGTLRARLDQIQTDLVKTVTPRLQPTTKTAFGLANSAHQKTALALLPELPRVAFAATQLKTLGAVDLAAPMVDLEADRDRWLESRQEPLGNQLRMAANPNLGNLQLQESSDRPVFPGSPSDPNIPFAPPVPSGCDPELGCLRLQIPAAAAAATPVMYLLPRLDIFRSNNILSGLNPVEDGLIRPGISLLVLPALGPNTYINASAEVALNQYFRLTQFNYSEFKFKAGIFQRFSPAMSGEIGWTNQQFFISTNQIVGLSAGTRFLDDHSIRLELSRQDKLAKNLSLNSFYQFRVSFTEPRDRSRIINVLFLSLNYNLNPRVQLGLDYQFASANFTVQPRTDLYHQVLGRISYSAFRTTQISLYGGLSTGTSTESAINFNSFILGVSVSLNLIIF